jgi:hypothetical protein
MSGQDQITTALERLFLVQPGLAPPEHAEFAARLRQAPAELAQ